MVQPRAEVPLIFSPIMATAFSRAPGWSPNQAFWGSGGKNIPLSSAALLSLGELACGGRAGREQLLSLIGFLQALLWPQESAGNEAGLGSSREEEIIKTNEPSGSPRTCLYSCLALLPGWMRHQ